MKPRWWSHIIIYLSKLTVYSGLEFEQTLGDSKRQSGLACCNPWGHRVGHDLVTEQQQCTRMNPNVIYEL